MKKLVLLTSMLFAINSSAVLANEEAEEAPEEHVFELLEQCSQVADEKGVEADELNAFLKKCVNKALKEAGFKPIKKLPATEEL